MATRLDGRIIVVTGASRGMGLAISAAFADEGAQVVMIARSEGELCEAAATVPRALYFACDISDPDAIRAVFANILTKHGAIDVLINNAAVANPAPIEGLDDAVAQQEVAINLLGPIYCIRAVLPSMREQGRGDIINVTSESVKHPYPHLGLYAATKAAVETLSVALRNELKGTGIRVAVYRSGRVKGTFSRDWDPDAAAKARAAALALGYYSMSGEAIDPAIVGKAMVDLVLLDRSAHVDLLDLRSI